MDSEDVDGQERSAAPRGWHGMTARKQTRYTREDWNVYRALGAGDFLIVDVVDYSPAWRGGIRNGAWVLEINGKPFEAFERCGAPVGASVNVKTLHAARGHVETLLVLADPPKKDQMPAELRRSRLRHCECGSVIRRDQRPKWEQKLAKSGVTSSTVRIGVFLCNEAINNDGSTARHSYGVIAKALGLDRSTVRRGLGQLREAGFASIESGQRARRINRITLTLPIEPAEVVVPFVIPDRPLARAITGAASKSFTPRDGETT